MPGVIVSIAVEPGQKVGTGDVLCIVEAMKMENEVRAPHAGVVEQLSVAAGQPVTTGQVICVVAAGD
jgi:biotin carboxyl carrier protein